MENPLLFNLMENRENGFIIVNSCFKVAYANKVMREVLVDYKNIVTIQPSRKEYHKKECSFSEVLLVNVMKIESYFPLKCFQYFR